LSHLYRTNPVPAVTSDPRSDAAEVVLLMEARDMACSGRAARLRAAAGVSQADLAAAVGVSASCVSRWEAGDRRPGGRTAPAYARVLRRIARELTRTADLLQNEGLAGQSEPLVTASPRQGRNVAER
jgi:DNA-binding XRE family transcriptional regulator